MSCWVFAKSPGLVGSFSSDKHSGFKEAFHLESFFTRNERYIIDCLSKSVETRVIVPFYNYLKAKHGDKIDQWLEQNGLKGCFEAKLAKIVDTTSQLMMPSKEAKDETQIERKHKIHKIKSDALRSILAKSTNVSERVEMNQSKNANPLGDGKNLLDFLTNSKEQSGNFKLQPSPTIPQSHTAVIQSKDPRLLTAGIDKIPYTSDFGHVKQPVYNLPPEYPSHTYTEYPQYRYPPTDPYYHRQIHPSGGARVPNAQPMLNPEPFYDPRHYYSLGYDATHSSDLKYAVQSPVSEDKKPIINFIPLTPITQFESYTDILPSITTPSSQMARPDEGRPLTTTESRPQLWDLLKRSSPEVIQPAPKGSESSRGKIEDMFSKIFQGK